MQKLKKLRIKTESSINFPWYGGEYKNSKGDIYPLTNPQALTLSVMQSIKSSEERFEFFCFAYLRQIIRIDTQLLENKLALEKYQLWMKKYGLSWHGNVRNTLPIIEPVLDVGVVTERGLNQELLKKKYNVFASHEFYIYESPYCEPNKKFNFVRDVDHEHNPVCDFDVGNYNVYYHTANPNIPMFAVS